MLLAGGLGSNNDVLATAENYFSELGTFTTISAPMIESREFHSASLLPNGLVLLAGGQYNSGGAVATSELFHPNSIDFVASGPTSAARQSHTATTFGQAS